MSSDTPTTAHNTDVEVRVVIDDSGNAEFLYDGRPKLGIKVDRSSRLILGLHLADGSGSFVTHPINWFSGPLDHGEPTPEPRTMNTGRKDSRTVFVIDENLSSGPYLFTLSVLLDGVVHTSKDPTILNRPDGVVFFGVPI